MSAVGGLTEARRRVADAISRISDPASRVTVHTDHAPDWQSVDQWIDNPDLDDAYDHRHVFVFAAGKMQAANASRQKRLAEYRVEVVVLERYDGAEAVPLDDWVDARIDWVELELFDRFNDARIEPYPVEGFFPQSVEWEDVYDDALLREQKLFQSVLVLTLRRLEE